MSRISLTEAERCGCPRVTVDVVIFSLRDHYLRVLLVSRDRWPHEGTWAIPGGEVGPGEALEAAAVRTLESQSGLTDVFLEQLYTFGDPERDPRMRTITVAYYAALPSTALRSIASSESETVHWWPVPSTARAGLRPTCST